MSEPLIKINNPITDGNRTVYGDYITIYSDSDLLEAICLMAKQSFLPGPKSKSISALQPRN